MPSISSNHIFHNDCHCLKQSGSTNTGNRGGGDYGGSDYSKKDDFRRYLEKTGVLDALTKVLVGLYEEPDRPVNALDYIKRYLGAPTGVDADGLRRENDDLKKQVAQLRKQLAEKK